MRLLDLSWMGVCLLLISLISSAPVSAQADPENFFKIPANTIIRVRTVEGVSSESARVGDVVPMEVLSDVIVNGFVVVKQGSPAVGEISRAQEARTLGRRGKVALTLNYVEAVTGEHILVGGNRSEKGDGKVAKLTAEIALTTAATGGLIGALWLFEKGHDSFIPPGTAFSVYTAGDTRINPSLLSAAHTSAITTDAPHPASITLGPATSTVSATSLTESSPLPRPMSGAAMDFPSLGVLLKTKLNVGAEVVSVVRGSPAEKAGLKVGYVLGLVDDTRVTNVREFYDAFGNRAPGSTVRLSWLFKSNLGWMPTAETTVVLAGPQ
jgi:PDZ domain